jgi:hypothetical protein
MEVCICSVIELVVVVDACGFFNPLRKSNLESKMTGDMWEKAQCLVDCTEKSMCFGPTNKMYYR